MVSIIVLLLFEILQKKEEKSMPLHLYIRFKFNLQLRENVQQQNYCIDYFSIDFNASVICITITYIFFLSCF